MCRRIQALAEQGDVEAQGPVDPVALLLGGGEQVEQQRAKAGLLQDLGHAATSRAGAAAAAAIGEHHQGAGVGRQRQAAGEIDALARQHQVVFAAGEGAHGAACLGICSAIQS
jgi:hypothetical protein